MIGQFLMVYESTVKPVSE